MARGVPKRRLRRLVGRPSPAQLRNRRHRRRILSPQGSPRPYRTTLPPAPRRQIMSTPPEPSQPPAHLRPPHRRDPSLLDTRGGACGVRADRRIARQDLRPLQPSTTGSASRAAQAVVRMETTRTLDHRPTRTACSPTEPTGITTGPDQKSSCCSIKTAIPSSRPAHYVPARAAAVNDGRRPPRSGAQRH